MDQPIGNRLDRWFAGYGLPGTVYLPLVMVDSGDTVRSGSEDYHTAYSAMVDTAMDRAPTARMTATGTLAGSLMRFDVQLTNTSGTTLSAANGATLVALLWSEPVSSSTVPIVGAVGSVPISTLDDGDTGAYSFEVPIGSLSPARLRWVVLAEARPPDSTGAYDMLQAVAGP
ncbi:MAG: hypothetical protein AB1Z65_04515 [Candidatus Sulfomarinibacteraceae bacterium]